ncbi:hypothetical protein PsorP6_006241 [Peronosclerospora sorghi]|uniref:Uncharacterized protein n=1 Tax=Peronosclerospora sorghi TaxID=230839 RepID=A0ACC0W3H5_9STRA|nr:hypothetical protein PsorP6_006241 [Peronosclerospora sorghi]
MLHARRRASRLPKAKFLLLRRALFPTTPCLERVYNGSSMHRLRISIVASLLSLPYPLRLSPNYAPECGKLTAELNIHEMLEYLASDTQPEVWRQSRTHLRDFCRIPHQGISFVCTSNDALSRLGGVQLKFCDTIVTIRKHSSYEALFRGLFTPSSGWARYGHIRLVCCTRKTTHLDYAYASSRTVYFHPVDCPEQVFEPNGEPLREITFVEGRNLVSSNIAFVTPRSLCPQPRRPSEISDACMDSAEDDILSRPSSDPEASLSTTSHPVQTTPPAEESPPTIPSSVSGPSTQPEPDLSRRIILGSVDATAAPSWQLVQHSQYVVINREGPKFLEPYNIQSCDLSHDDSDPNSLVYSIPVMTNMYNMPSGRSL